MISGMTLVHFIFVSPLPGVFIHGMIVFGGLLIRRRRARLPPEAQTGYSTGQQCRHPQGGSECKQVFIISCDVEGEFVVSNWMQT